MPLYTAFLLLCAGIGAEDRVIDDFQFSRQADGTVSCGWTANSENAAIEPVTTDGSSALKLAAPFADHPELDRVYVDRDVELDLSRAREFVLEIEADRLDAISAITVYFRSKSGWYGCYGGLDRAGRQKVVFPKALFRPEGDPAGWHQVDRIRIAAWQARPENAEVLLHRLSVPQSSILIVTANPGIDDAALSRETAVRCERMLARHHLKTDLIEEESLATTDLQSYRVVIFPYNPRLDPKFFPSLLEYIDGGGKVFLNYRLHGPLGEALGFKGGTWKKRRGEGNFAEIRFDPDANLPGLPEGIRQNSWNISTAEPAAHGARVLGRWYDADGRPTGDAALLVSDRGAYFSHILLEDDFETKSAALAAILGSLAPELWREVAQRGLESLEGIGHGGVAETEAWILSQANGAAVAALEESRAAAGAAEKALSAGSFHEAVRLATAAVDARRKAYLLSHPSPEQEGRGFWNHSGTGAYPGDWDRTMRELAESGFNMVYPNMCWGGCAHYASDVLPRSSTYDELGDQIEQCVAAGKKYGVEVHVWKVNFYLSHRTPKEFVEKLREEGRLQKSAGGEELLWLCPSHPDNFRLERDAMLEVAEKYDVDGVHFDYIRYSGPQYCYCDGCRERFEADRGEKVENWPDDCSRGSLKEEYNRWKCDRITRIVKAVHEGVRRLQPEVRVSAAVFNSYPSCTTSVSQDWLLWAKSGYVDFLCPMNYTNSERTFRNTVARQLELVDGAVPLYPGIGASASSSHLRDDQVASQVFHARELGAAGFTVFNLSRREAAALLPGLKLGVGRDRAVPPTRTAEKRR